MLMSYYLLSVCLQWIRACFPKDGERRLLVWDACRVHLTAKVKEELKKRNIDTAVIPGGMTSLLQPLDVSVNKPVKSRLRQYWTDWMVDGPKHYNAGGKRKSPTREDVLQWIADAWGTISSDIITGGFLKCGIANKMDGSEDDALYADVVAEKPTKTEGKVDSDSETDSEEFPPVPDGLWDSETDGSDFEGFS